MQCLCVTQELKLESTKFDLQIYAAACALRGACQQRRSSGSHPPWHTYIHIPNIGSPHTSPPPPIAAVGLCSAVIDADARVSGEMRCEGGAPPYHVERRSRRLCGWRECHLNERVQSVPFQASSLLHFKPLNHASASVWSRPDRVARAVHFRTRHYINHATPVVPRDQQSS